MIHVPAAAEKNIRNAAAATHKPAAAGNLANKNRNIKEMNTQGKQQIPLYRSILYRCFGEPLFSLILFPC